MLLVSRYGTPSLLPEDFSRDRLFDTYQRLFPAASEEDFNHFIKLFSVAEEQPHGSLLVVAQDAESEADRLGSHGTRIEPTKLTPDLYRQVSDIDGATLIKPHGICYAIGVILDGPAQPVGMPSRGARYNSAKRYVDTPDTRRLAVVVSTDQTVDVFPMLRPRIRHSDMAKVIAELEAATSDNYHTAASWLDRHRFYLNQEQCDRINAALDRFQREPLEVGQVRILRSKFSPDSDFDDSYLATEDTGTAES